MDCVMLTLSNCHLDVYWLYELCIVPGFEKIEWEKKQTKIEDDENGA